MRAVSGGLIIGSNANVPSVSNDWAAYNLDVEYQNTSNRVQLHIIAFQVITPNAASSCQLYGIQKATSGILVGDGLSSVRAGIAVSVGGENMRFVIVFTVEPNYYFKALIAKGAADTLSKSAWWCVTL